MAQRTKLEEKLEGLKKFLAWKYGIGLILRENGLQKYINNQIIEAEAKEKHEQDLIKAMRIIVDSIKDHLVPQVSSKKTPKQMYDALSRIYGGNNINKR